MESLPTHNPAISITNNADHTGKEGYAVKHATKLSALVAADDSIDVFGVIVTGAASGDDDSVCPCVSGSVTKVKLAASPGTVNNGSVLGTHTDGSFKVTASTKNACAIALEDGAANELIDAILFRPELTA